MCVVNCDVQLRPANTGGKKSTHLDKMSHGLFFFFFLSIPVTFSSDLMGVFSTLKAVLFSASEDHAAHLASGVAS